ncbi:MAG: hypothetical protein LBQ66_10785 [Planctomycetaceae bacterium]|nr:hypothetical protein [Planctomycetaceae bacterium]
MPTRFGVQFQLVRFYYAQRRAGRPRSSPRRFAANLCGITRVGCPRSSPRRFAANLCGITMALPYAMIFDLFSVVINRMFSVNVTSQQNPKFYIFLLAS